MADTWETTIRHYVVAVLDILGQREALQRWSQPPRSTDEEPAFQEAVYSTFEGVIAVRKDLLGLLARYITDHHVPEEAIRTNGGNVDAVRKFQHMTPRILQFSDMILAYCPLVNVNGVLTAEPIVCFLISVGRALLLGLSRQTPLRGAIDIGLAGCLPETDDLYGPVLAEAHRLESKVAVYPRIVLGSNLVRFVSETWAYADQVNRGLADTFAKLVTRDDDRCLIVDYLGEFAKGLDGSPAHWEPARKNAYSFVQSELARFHAAGNIKLKDRYARLLRYFHARGFKPEPQVILAG
jgi:hypothetical protein